MHSVDPLPGPPPQKGEGNDIPKPRLVVIEDEPETANLVKVFLEMFAFEVTTALTGALGLEAIKSVTPQAVILDIMLPDMNGLEILRRLRDDPATARLPVIILSARTLKEDVRSGYEAGATLYFKKPVDMNRLLEGARQVVAEGRHVTRPLDQQALDAEERPSVDPQSLPGTPPRRK